MNEEHLKRISDELKIKVNQVRSTAELLGDGGTVPFIARYRKEATGSLDEVAITSIRDRIDQLAELDKRRGAILKSLEERELLTDELRESLLAAETMAALEDLYLSYRPKRRTRAIIAKEKGLEPLAQTLLAQEGRDPGEEAATFINPDKGLETVDDCLAGARDIIAEWVNEDSEARAAIRSIFLNKGKIRSKVVPGKEEEGTKFSDYYDCAEDLVDAPGHRVLAMFRGERDGILSLQIRPTELSTLQILKNRFVKPSDPASEQVTLAVEDSYKRLMAPSLETETRNEVKKRADEEAIRVFAANLRELLMAPPLGRKRVMALDPGFRTGAKLVVLDRQGKLVHNTTIFPTHSKQKAEQAGKTVHQIVERNQVEAIAIGNGTASRETESFVRSLGLPQTLPIVMVNESGASIYSASKAAREEFPNQDVTVRGAVSIGRRLVDPLAELVKIDPKSIGVGQYQHDVDQGDLKLSLDDVVTSCVSAVGVEVNTASKELLTYVAGLGPTLAGNIVAWRNENGPFRSRKQLLKVPRLGPKAFQQAAGFLRIRDGDERLDASAIHPESYTIVRQMADDMDCSVSDLMKSQDLRGSIQLKTYVTDTVGLPTLSDIVTELAKPGRDPRAEFETFAFAEDVNAIEDLKPGMKLPGIVTNVTRFGAFVDVGVHQDGLMHISQLADHYVKDPTEVVKVSQKVTVTVLEVDMARNRISLSMREGSRRPARQR